MTLGGAISGRLYGRTRREVPESLIALIRDIHQGIPVATERQTLGQFLQHCLNESVKPSVRPKTHVSYKQQVRIHIAPALGRYPLRKLSPQHVQSWLNQKLESGLSPRTVQYLRATLRCALNQALRRGLITRNVAALVDAPRVTRPETQTLDPEQARALLDAVKGEALGRR